MAEDVAEPLEVPFDLGQRVHRVLSEAMEFLHVQRLSACHLLNDRHSPPRELCPLCPLEEEVEDLLEHVFHSPYWPEVSAVDCKRIGSAVYEFRCYFMGLDLMDAIRQGEDLARKDELQRPLTQRIDKIRRAMQKDWPSCRKLGVAV